MKYLTLLALVLPMFVASLSGCGASVSEVAPMTEAGTDPPPEQQKNWMEESRNRGGAPKNVKAPKPAKDEKKEESPTP